ncbi:hypothetical protein [Palleronia caenipelagi]|uniref:Metal-binding protein n=1 Tax=Palleronia caenipelagi TaxID=2489174 RepID=A0A547PIN7_9RHOB|nr:hypothetical protein [Palleronia caenipelagi]TRD13990.1 hypothetical protein FEV53_19680 [Palleronia caenipelagi]
MAYQNRVDPFSQLHAVSARGTLMGNRGILHDAAQEVIHTHRHPNWVACALSYKNAHREIMQPHNYTELFFLDEATAFSAGHRPCAACRRDRYKEFCKLWEQVHGAAEFSTPLPQTIDKALHRARITRQKEKVTFDARISELPDGVFFAQAGASFLIWRGRILHWSFDGYVPHALSSSETVQVLTPQPIVDLFGAGYLPEVHQSAQAM